MISGYYKMARLTAMGKIRLNALLDFYRLNNAIKFSPICRTLIVSLLYLFPSPIAFNSAFCQTNPTSHKVDNEAAPLLSENQTKSSQNQGPSQDQQFLALVHVRDTQLAAINDLRRIVDYHDGFRNRLSQVLDIRDKYPRTRDAVLAAIDGELKRIEKFENDVKDVKEGVITSNDANTNPAQANSGFARSATLVSIAQDFNKDFPLFREHITQNTNLLAQESIETNQSSLLHFSSQNDLSDRSSNLLSIAAFLRTEKQTSKDLFQNVFYEYRELGTRYDNLLKNVQVYAVIFGHGPELSHLESLPTEFYTLIGAPPSWSGVTKEQILNGVSMYRTALQESKKEVPDAPQTEKITTAKNEINAAADSIGSELKAAESNQSALVDQFEKQISASAKSIYGNAIGADSFTYLLIVFAAVFLIIMVAPYFYSDKVALNLLKAEFLLQFSTVFVLIAAIIILGIGNLIQPDQLPVLLAGISGYVLGQLGRTQTTPSGR